MEPDAFLLFYDQGYVSTNNYVAVYFFYNFRFLTSCMLIQTADMRELRGLLHPRCTEHEFDSQ